MESLKEKLTEEEAREYVRKNCNFNNYEISYDIREKVNIYFFDLLKKEGCIKQNPVEKAHSIIANLSISPSETWDLTIEDINKLVNGFRYLEDELKKQLEEK